MVAATVFHSKTATAADDPTYNIVPSDWNSHHAVTMALQGADFANSNGVTFGVSANGVVTASVAAAAGGAGVAVSAGTTQATSGTVSYANSNGITWGLNGQTLTGSVQTNYQSTGAYLTTAALSQDSSKYAGTATTMAAGLSATLNTLGLNLSIGAYLTTAALSGDSSKYAGTGFTSTTTAGTAIVATHNTAGLSMGIPAFLTTAQSAGAYLTTAALSQDSSKYAGTSTGMTGGSVTLNTSGIAISLPAYLTTADLSQNSSRYAGTGTSTGTVAGMFQQVTLNTNGISILEPIVVISSYENMAFPQSSSLNVMNAASVSAAVQFLLPVAGSFSFFRIPVSFSTNSTTFATTGASLSASAVINSTWNVVVYSLGTGASSRSLQSVASGSAGWTVMNSISVAANGTQYSITQAISGFAEGIGTTVTSQYSISNTNYSFVSTGPINSFNGVRWLDINFANSLSAGEYWAIMGYSSSSATNSTGIQPASNANISYTAQFGMSQASLAPRVMGSAANSASGIFGAGSFSTAGGGTTASLDISALTSIASNVRAYFQMARSA